jgi:hypothetical protein
MCGNVVNISRSWRVHVVGAVDVIASSSHRHRVVISSAAP